VHDREDLLAGVLGIRGSQAEELDGPVVHERRELGDGLPPGLLVPSLQQDEPGVRHLEIPGITGPR
jgi:hypothetical protein